MTTGKNKIEFENWYYKKYKREQNKKGYLIPSKLDEQSPFECRIGVYLAYYDSVKLIIETERFFIGNRFVWDFVVYHKQDRIENLNVQESRNEAYKAAFKEADKLRNKEL